MFTKEELSELKNELKSIDLEKENNLLETLKKINDKLLSPELDENSEYYKIFYKYYEEIINFLDKKGLNQEEYFKYKIYYYYRNNKYQKLRNVVNAYNLEDNDILILLIELLIKNNCDKEDVFYYVKIILNNKIDNIYTFNIMSEILKGEYKFDLGGIDKTLLGEDLQKGGKISPKELNGHWDKGYCLDEHTILDIKSKNLHPRSYVGELLYCIKYRYKKSDIPKLGEILGDFILGKYTNFINGEKPFEKIDFIIPVPPSNLNRPFQPVYEIGNFVSSYSLIPIKYNYLKKIKNTSQTKNLKKEEAKKLLKGAFNVKNIKDFENKNILILDDLFGTGTTLNEITKCIRENTKVNKIFVLTVTKTRTESGLRS